MRKLFILAALATVVGLMSLGGGNQAQATDVLCGATLSAAGTTTTLHADVPVSGSCSGTALTIDANDITLDCAGKKLTGDGTGLGILLDGVSGVTVKKCKVTNFAAGIVLDGSSNNFLVENEVTGSTSGGSGAFTLRLSDGNVLQKNNAEDNNGRGFLLENNSDGNFLAQNLAKENDFRGYDVETSSDGNVLFDNKAEDNGSAGFVVAVGSTGNILKHNEAIKSSVEGFAMLSSGNFLVENLAKANTTFGIRDSTGPANTYIGNVCDANGTGPSSPATLC